MFELRDTIRRLDDETDYRYDLTGMYEATELSEPEKKLIAAMIADAKDPEEIAGELFKIFNTQNAMNMDEDCDGTLTEDVKEEIQDGDEIVYNGEHLFVTNADYMDLGKWLWVTDKEEDRYNKKASGWSLAKELVDEVIGQPDEEELDESLKDFMFTVKCNDGPKELIKVVAEDKAKAEEYAKKMYAQNHTTYADDRHNKWSIEDGNCLNETLYGIKESEEDGLENATQEYTSANTSINSAKLPAIFSMVNFKPETINLDYGGGKFDNATTALEGKGVTNLVYDPYNRSSGHNKDVIDTVRKNGGADTVTCSNVLNVIKEPEARKAAIKNIYSLLKNSGTAYFTVYEGTGKGNEGPTKSGYQLNKKTGDYVEEISSVFPSVSRRGKLIIASKGASITEEFDDDWSDTLETGGEPTYCPDCGVKFVRDEEGDAICPKCNKTPYQLANERRKNESLNEDDRYNVWSIEDKSDLHEALHGMNEIEQFVKMANQIGLKTMGDVKNFLDREGDGKDILTALYDYLYNEIGDLEFQAKDESLKESDDSQFDKAVEAMKAYWNYQMSLEQLHNTLLKIYNNDAEKAFKVFVEYGDAARRAKDECLNCDPKKENVPTVKEETLKEDNDAEEWEEVASKAVEDSDGFMTDYVWYTDGNKHVFVFGDSDIYRPEDGDFDWEVDIVKGKEAESYKEAQDWFDSYNGFAEELDEAQDVYDIQGQAVRDSKRKEVLDEFKDIFGTGDNGEVNIDSEETLGYVRSFLEDQGYSVLVSDSTNAEHPIHIEWFK